MLYHILQIFICKSPPKTEVVFDTVTPRRAEHIIWLAEHCFAALPIEPSKVDFILGTPEILLKMISVVHSVLTEGHAGCERSQDRTVPSTSYCRIARCSVICSGRHSNSNPCPDQKG